MEVEGGLDEREQEKFGPVITGSHRVPDSGI